MTSLSLNSIKHKHGLRLSGNGIATQVINDTVTMFYFRMKQTKQCYIPVYCHQLPFHSIKEGIGNRDEKHFELIQPPIEVFSTSVLVHE